MQEKVTKAIITASYDNDGQEGPVEEKARKQYDKEVANGYYLPTHVFYRDLNEHRVTKFNFPIPLGPKKNQKLPMILFPTLSASKTNLEKIAIVGDNITKINIEKFKEYSKTKKVTFVYEGEPKDWSVSNTIERGAQTLTPEDDELVYILMGDTLMKYDFERNLTDPDINNADLISDFNSRRRTNKHWPRKFHWKLNYRGIPYLVKESQDLLVNIPKMREFSENLGLQEHIFDLLYGSRKAHANKGKSRVEKISEVIRDNPSILPMAIAASPIYVLNLLRWAATGKKGPLPLSSKGIYRATKFATGTRFLIKSEGNDPASIEDIDGLSDWANLSEMLITSKGSIHPHYRELLSFGESMMPELRRELNFYEGFEDYMNSIFKRYDLPEPFIANGEFRNPFTSPEMEKLNPVIANRAKKIIKRSTKKHKKYLRKKRTRDIKS